MKRTLTRLAGLILMIATLFSSGEGQTIGSESLTPGDNLVVEGIPPIPMSLVKEVERYGDTEWATFVAWHPTKREMLVAPNRRGSGPAQLYLVKSPLGRGCFHHQYDGVQRGADESEADGFSIGQQGVDSHTGIIL